MATRSPAAAATDPRTTGRLSAAAAGPRVLDDGVAEAKLERYCCQSVRRERRKAAETLSRKSSGRVITWHDRGEHGPGARCLRVDADHGAVFAGGLRCDVLLTGSHSSVLFTTTHNLQRSYDSGIQRYDGCSAQLPSLDIAINAALNYSRSIPRQSLKKIVADKTGLCGTTRYS